MTHWSSRTESEGGSWADEIEGLDDIGLMHGMAGSAALIVLTAATLHSPWWGLVYIVLFGVGSIVGMALLSLVIALPITYAARSVGWAHKGLQLCVGLVTIAIGTHVLVESGSILL